MTETQKDASSNTGTGLVILLIVLIIVFIGGYWIGTKAMKESTQCICECKVPGIECPKCQKCVQFLIEDRNAIKPLLLDCENEFQ